MTTATRHYRAFNLFVDLNLDRFIYALAIIGGLALGSYLGTAFLSTLQ